MRVEWMHQLQRMKPEMPLVNITQVREQVQLRQERTVRIQAFQDIQHWYVLLLQVLLKLRMVAP